MDFIDWTKYNEIVCFGLGQSLDTKVDRNNTKKRFEFE